MPPLPLQPLELTPLSTLLVFEAALGRPQLAELRVHVVEALIELEDVDLDKGAAVEQGGAEGCC